MKTETARTGGKSVKGCQKTSFDSDLRNIKPNYRPRATARREAWQRVNLADAAEHFQSRAKANNTDRTYTAAVKQYRDFCRVEGFDVLPGDAEAVRQFLVFLAIRRGLSISTIKTRFAGLRQFYRDQVGRENVTQADSVRNCINGLERELGEPPVRAPALCADDIRRILRKLPREDGVLTVASLRDRALLLVVYAGAFRRSEAAGLLRQDVVFEDGSARIFLRRSKTDQKSEGRWVGIGRGKRRYTCPVRALQAWFEVSPTASHVFHPVDQWGNISDKPMQDKGVGRIVKRLAHLGGLDPETFTAHSLRAGVVTDLNAAGVPTAVVQECSRHRAPSMVARYNRPSDVNRVNYTRRAGL